MRAMFLVVLTAALMASATPTFAAPIDDATVTVTSVLDKFNGGDINAFFAAHRDGALIIDEFAPFVWGGPQSVQRWASDYEVDAKRRGIRDGRIDYGKPIQANSDGISAYIVLPATYRFTQNGTKMAGVGSMAFVMAHEPAGWKISSWTYSGATSTPER